MTVAPPRVPTEQYELHRNLSRRHINLIALGGAIGTGLFVATGASVNSAGPGEPCCPTWSSAWRCTSS